MYTEKQRHILYLALFVFVLSICLYIMPMVLNDTNTFDFEYINTKDMTTSEIGNKQDTTSFLSMLYFPNDNDLGTVQEMNTRTVNPEKNVQNKRIWYLPTVHGKITQYPSYSHFALDISSPNNYSENIFPIANGRVSSIYTDSAGAKIVTVNHNINGVRYTSQYVHLSRYSKGLHVGQNVTINDCLGKMGRTGIATGVHLHLALVRNCSFHERNNKCSSLKGFFRQGKNNYRSGFRGLNSVMKVPKSWKSR